METTQQANLLTAGKPARDIPTPPGGGSWTFDEESWKWVLNDPASELPTVAGVDVANTNTEQE